jgi:hypothetical protein
MVRGNTQKYRHCLCARPLYCTVRSPLYKVLFAIPKHQTILKQFPLSRAWRTRLEARKVDGPSAGATSANPTHTVRSLKVGRPDDLSISHHRADGTLFFSLRMLSRLFTRYRPIKSTLNVYPVNRFATYSNMSSILEPIAKKFKASKVNCIPHVYGDRQLESYLPSLDWTNRPLERTRAHSMRMNPSAFPC